jgi:hypothetical protein
MDQNASEDKILLRHLRKCGEDPNLDCHIRLCAGGNHQKETENRAQSLHNFTDFKYLNI